MDDFLDLDSGEPPIDVIKSETKREPKSSEAINVFEDDLDTFDPWPLETKLQQNQMSIHCTLENTFIY
ncbi:hypothetical protein HHI36_019880 [Cryptolaemus montrouzieri]|uniref:Uncharacterized protein n=1 Tax=Cryptolaemus montrouzieri TaxID=559131 RepID=A0ABD2N922_9CUCU